MLDRHAWNKTDRGRQRHTQQRNVNPDITQSAVECKLQNFHSKLASLEFYSFTS